MNWYEELVIQLIVRSSIVIIFNLIKYYDANHLLRGTKEEHYHKTFIEVKDVFLGTDSKS